MATVTLPRDFREFLQLLTSAEVRFLVIGGYAVGYHGYPRATIDLDVWIEPEPRTAQKLVAVLKEFGFNLPQLREELFLVPGKVIRMGVPPMRLEILTSIDGVTFAECYENRLKAALDGLEVPMIALSDLKANKRASGRHKDLDDLEHLP